MIRANSLDRRMARLERRLRPPRGLFFLAWGRDQDEIEAALTRAAKSGLIGVGDTVVQATWPEGKPMPPCRWIVDEMGALTREELDALGENIMTRAETEGWSRSSEPSDERNEARQLTDEALIGLALGLPWGGDATASK